jgi:hypothetical protein
MRPGREEAGGPSQRTASAEGATVDLTGAPAGSAGGWGNVRAADWLYRSRTASVLWLVARLWLGYGWVNAGYQKLWGSEKAAFWDSGAGVKGFATAGVTGSTAGKGAGASYGWWAAFLHDFVIPNASWIAKVVTISRGPGRAPGRPAGHGRARRRSAGR